MREGGRGRDKKIIDCQHLKITQHTYKLVGVVSHPKAMPTLPCGLLRPPQIRNICVSCISHDRVGVAWSSHM